VLRAVISYLVGPRVSEILHLEGRLRAASLRRCGQASP
jgi:hypothetical protein